MRAIIFDLDHTLFSAEQVLHDGVIDLLGLLQALGIRIGAFSNDDHRAIVRLDEAGIRPYFDRIVCAEHHISPKGRAALEQLLESLGAGLHETTLVSHAASDIMLGREAGLAKTIGISHGPADARPLHFAGAHYIVEDMPAVLDVLE